jgi:hypothetical protein
LHRLSGALDQTAAAPHPGLYRAQSGPRRGHIGLFTGCATGVMQG